jgi:hypothetical protein
MLVIVLHLISTGSNLYSWGGLFLSLKHKVAVCDHKTIACYRERTAITSLNRSKARTAQKSSNLTDKFRHLQDIFRIKTGRVQPLQMPVISLILDNKRLILYGTCLTLGHKKIS